MANKTTDYKRQFNAEKYDRMEVTVPKGEKPKIKNHAEGRGESLNGFVNRAIVETIERDKGGVIEVPPPQSNTMPDKSRIPISLEIPPDPALEAKRLAALAALKDYKP